MKTDNIIAVFDFDGTLTKKDTLLEFIVFTKGRLRCYATFLLFSPLLLAYVLNIYSNWKLKQLIFKFLYRGMPYATFCHYGELFANKINEFLNTDTIAILENHQKQGHSIYVVSASIEEWVAPWCLKHGVNCVIGTKVEVSKDGYLTGKFSSKNCYGVEKVERFLENEPNRNDYFLYAYGDSVGDREMITFADKGLYIK